MKVTWTHQSLLISFFNKKKKRKCDIFIKTESNNNLPKDSFFFLPGNAIFAVYVFGIYREWYIYFTSIQILGLGDKMWRSYGFRVYLPVCWVFPASLLRNRRHVCTFWGLYNSVSTVMTHRFDIICFTDNYFVSGIYLFNMITRLNCFRLQAFSKPNDY